MSQQQQLEQLAMDLANESDDTLQVTKLSEARANFILGLLRGYRARARAILKDIPNAPW